MKAEEAKKISELHMSNKMLSAMSMAEHLITLRAKEGYRDAEIDVDDDIDAGTLRAVAAKLIEDGFKCRFKSFLTITTLMIEW